jgi:hypothetical protein
MPHATTANCQSHRTEPQTAAHGDRALSPPRRRPASETAGQPTTGTCVAAGLGERQRNDRERHAAGVARCALGDLAAKDGEADRPEAG